MNIYGPQPPPDWLVPFIKRITKNWSSPGGISIGVDEFGIVVFPSLREIKGGKEDGSHVYASFGFDVSNFIRIFDKRPHIKFTTQQCPTIEITGKKDGNIVNIIIMCTPPTDLPPTENYYTYGPKKGKVEPVIYKEEDE